tara:strand:- start:2408 stop:2797 length:390 start_codon:yes stop_codon:yes gene_type:complete
MAVKQTGRKIYKSMQGKQVDMDLLRQRNELTPAVGNAKVNARGDELGPGGKIIKKREEVLRDFYEDNVAPTEFEQSVKPSEPQVDEEQTASVEIESVAPKRRSGQTKAQAKVEEQWVEDNDGNFVKKGD